MTIQRWWEPRREGEDTAEFLTRVLSDLGAYDLAEKARLYHFDDYRCPDDIDDGANINRLVQAVTDWSRSVSRTARDRAKVLIDAAKNGEFDGTREEADQWAQSPDGAATFAELISDMATAGPQRPARDDDQTLWVQSDVMADGAYGLSLNLGPDHAWPLDRNQAIDYAVTCIQRATEADHDVAVFRLLGAVGSDPVTAAVVISREIRGRRPVDHKPTAPLEFTTGIRRNLEPFITITLDGEHVGQLTPDELRAHAAHVLGATAAADLDAALFRALTDTVGLDEPTARAAVHSLADHWPDKQPS